MNQKREEWRHTKDRLWKTQMASVVGTFEGSVRTVVSSIRIEVSDLLIGSICLKENLFKEFWEMLTALFFDVVCSSIEVALFVKPPLFPHEEPAEEQKHLV